MKNYIQELNQAFSGVKVTDKKGRVLSAGPIIDQIAGLIIAKKNKGGKLIFIGNGGSASIASHATTDLLKNARIPAISFSDSSLLTCLSNDLGYEYVFQKPVEMLMQKEDVLFSISSSGSSKNILNAARCAREKGCCVVTLSGFGSRNPLRRLGDVNFYIPSRVYGYVEISHLIICHCIADRLMKRKKNG